MDSGGAGGSAQAHAQAGGQPWQSGPRTWRPRITTHAILRYAQRVVGLDLPDDADVIGQLKAGGADLAAIYEMIWPARMRLPADPGCAFAMLRGGFVYPVRGGVLRTVIWGRHYEEPGRIARGDELA